MIAFGRSDFVKRLPGISMLVAAVLCAFFLTSIASANASTRTLKLYFTHTKERAEITFKRNGRYDQAGLRKLNNFLRDWRQKEPTKMDPELFDLIWEVYQKTGSSKYIHVVSAYRSPKTNNMLRKRSSGVAKNSQHTKGRAMDFFIPGVSTAKLRALGLRQHVGGVGYYPRSNTPFVHMDTGSVRHWPRMSRRQLAKVFPKGDTIHIPSDGKPMARYKQTLAAVKRRGSGRSTTVASRSSRSAEKAGARVKSSETSGNFFSRLFSSSDGEKSSKPKTAPAKKAPVVREPDPSRRVNAEYNTIPQPKVGLLANKPAASPVPGAASPLALAAATPFAKPRAEADTTSDIAKANPALLATARPRIKPQQLIQVAALPAATPPVPQRAPQMPAAVETPKDGIAAIIAATGEQTPESLRPLANTRLAYASSTAGTNPAKDKFSKKTATAAQAPFAPQRLPDLMPKPQPTQQTIVAKAVHQAPMVGFHSAPQPNAVLMLDPTWTANNRRTITMQHPDQNQLAVLTTSVTSVLKDSFIKTPYRPIRKRINRGAAIAWLDSIYTGGMQVSSR